MTQLVNLGGILVGTGSVIRDDGKHVSYDCLLRYYGAHTEDVVFANEIFSWITGSDQTAIVATVANAGRDNEKLVLRRVAEAGRSIEVVGSRPGSSISGVSLASNEVLVAGTNSLRLIDLSSQTVVPLQVPAGFQPVQSHSARALYAYTVEGEDSILWRCTSAGAARIAKVAGKISSVAEISESELLVATWRPSDSLGGASFSVLHIGPSDAARTVYSESKGYMPVIEKQGELVLVEYVVYDPAKGMPRRALVLSGADYKPVERLALRELKAAALRDGRVVGVTHDGKIVSLNQR
ncbi:MAG TPA: hypothetical protein VHE61_18060 [Opitutaceae bacterium]|nr:hypothetical protein [Opitutaceae bacterium]